MTYYSRKDKKNITKPVNGSNYIDVYVYNEIQKGSIKVTKDWDSTAAEIEETADAILFKLDRIPETQTIGGTTTTFSTDYIYDNYSTYGLNENNIYQNEGTKYLKINKNGATWEIVTIDNLLMACLSTVQGQYETYPLVTCYYQVTEAGYLENGQFKAIDPTEITVTYTGDSVEEVDEHTVIKAKAEDPDTLTITNKSKFTKVEVQKVWDKDTPYSFIVRLKLRRRPLLIQQQMFI